MRLPSEEIERLRDKRKTALARIVAYDIERAEQQAKIERLKRYEDICLRFAVRVRDGEVRSRRTYEEIMEVVEGR